MVMLKFNLKIANGNNHYHGSDDMSGKVVVVTGANSGIGFHTSMKLAQANAIVVMACRNDEKARQAREHILVKVPKATLITMHIDLASFASIRQFVDEFRSKFDSLNVLINNAGVLGGSERELTVDGLEKQMGTNYFGVFLLTGLLLPLMARGGRIVTVSSATHFLCSNFLDDMNCSHSYRRWIQYSNSKAAVLMFTYALNQRLLLNSADRRYIVCIATHPGYAQSNNILTNTGQSLFKRVTDLFAPKAEEACRPLVKAACDRRVEASYHDYLGSQFILMGEPTVQATSSKTWSLAAQQKLWEESVRVTGMDFGGL